MLDKLFRKVKAIKRSHDKDIITREKIKVRDSKRKIREAKYNIKKSYWGK